MKVGVVLPIGFSLEPGVPCRYEGIREFARQAESAGMDSVWVVDHLLAGGTEDARESPWEAWTLLSALADATERVELGTLVLCTSFRNAGVLARMADTVQEVSGNRLILGIGCGWHQPEYTAFGLPFVGRVDGFDEAAQIITDMLREGRASVDGRYHRAVDAPVRERDGRVAPEILIAAKRPRMLDLTAKYADSWNLAWFGLPSARYRDTSAALDRACETAGRDPASLARTAGVLVHVDPPPPTEGMRPIGATPESVAGGLRAWQDEGVSAVVVSLEPITSQALDLLAEGLVRYRSSTGQDGH